MASILAATGNYHQSSTTIFRHRPAVGPQMTLYVPATLLKSGSNMLILLEQDHSPCLDHPEHCQVEFVDTPQINGPTPA